MDFKKIELSDKDLIRKYYTADKSFGAHYSFTNLYIWQESYNIEYAVYNGFLCIASRHSRRNNYYVMPCGVGDRKEAVDKIIEYAHSLGQKCVFAQMSQDECSFLKETYGDMFSYEEDRDNSEYVYKSEDLINLSGKKLHSKKNHLNTFLKTYDWKYERITEENIKEAEKFVINSITEREDHNEELLSAQKLFSSFFEIGVIGAILYADGEICAVTVGEMLSGNTAVIHLEKADVNVKGSYAAINNMFIKNEFSDVPFINREEDMGIEGLRKAKLSYKPDHLVVKCVAVEK